MIVYAVMYNPMIHESTWDIISLHTTRKGAETELAFCQNEPVEHDSEYLDWRIREIPLLTP